MKGTAPFSAPFSRARPLFPAFLDQIIATLQNLKILLRHHFSAFCGLRGALMREWQDLTTFTKGFLLNDPGNYRQLQAITGNPNASNYQ